LYGFVWSQSLLLCIWAVFGPQSIAVRTVGAVLACGFLWVVNLMPVAHEEIDNRYLDGVVSVLAVVPALFVVSTATMWPFRALRGWCIAHREMDQCGRATRFGQFGIFDVLVATALVAAVLGAYQFRNGFESAKKYGEIEFDDYAFWAFLAFGIVGAAVGMPSLGLAFGIKRKSIAAFLLFAYAFGVSIVLMAAFGWAFGPMTTGEGFYPACFMYFLTVLTISVGVLRWLRSRGYVLVHPRRLRYHPRQPELPATTADGNLTAEN
jgi:hypothetical protein